MLITEGLDYEYNKTELFKKYNWKNNSLYRPVRIFTYLMGNEKYDAQEMEWIACSNMGTFETSKNQSQTHQKRYSRLLREHYKRRGNSRKSSEIPHSHVSANQLKFQQRRFSHSHLELSVRRFGRSTATKLVLAETGRDQAETSFSRFCEEAGHGAECNFSRKSRKSHTSSRNPRECL